MPGWGRRHVEGMGTRGLGSAVIAVLWAAGCGTTVVVPGETEGGGGDGATSTTTTTAGQGGAASNTSSSGEGGTGNTTGPYLCATDCTVGPADKTCTCIRDCDGVFPPSGKASCAPVVDLQGNHKIECVCTVGDQFSGVCFEKNEAKLCDFNEGCCGKYFSGK